MKMTHHLVVAAVMLTVVTATATDFYVSPAGKDTNPGTKGKPFATLERARDEIRKLKTDGKPPKDGVTVYLRAGVYSLNQTFELNERDSGTPGKPIVYRAFGNERVNLLGGRIIPAEGFTRVTDPLVLQRLPKESHGEVLQIDLRAQGITDYGEHRQYGHALTVCPAAMELFFGDNVMTLARYPNQGFLRFTNVIDAGSVPRNRDYSERGGTFEYMDERHARWAGVEDVWFQGTFGNGYADDFINVASIDPATRRVKFTTPHLYGLGKGKYTALNLLAELDQPGEWYVDRKTGILYFWPPSDIRKSRIAVSMFEDPIIAMEGVSYVTLRGLTIEVGRGIGVYIERGQNNLIAGCTVRNVGTSGIFMGQGARQTFPQITHDDYEGVPISRQVGNLQGHIYKYTTWDRQAGKNHGVVSCDVYDTGSGGIYLSGGSKKDLIPGHCYVENSRVHDYNRRNKFCWSGINIDGCGNRIAHCEIFNSGFFGIYAHGNDHLFEYNNIHDVCMTAEDIGAWYIGRDPSDRGNVIRHNFFHHCGTGGFQMGIYFDDATTDVTVEGNVFYKMGTEMGAVFSNAGQDLQVRNNIIFDCVGPAVRLDSMWYTWAPKNNLVGYFFGDDGVYRRRLTRLLDIKQPPYSARYPELADWMDPIEGSKDWIGMRPRRNVMENNVVSRCARKLKLEGERAQFEDLNNFQTEEPLGFVNAANMDFRLRSDSIVFKKLPGFKPIPFEKIGLYVDEYCRGLPVAAPDFGSATRVFVDAGQVALTLPPRSGHAAIRYTLDGTEPTAASSRYKKPVTLRENTTVRAAAFADGERSAIVTADFVVRKLGPDAGVYLSELVELDSFAHGGLKKDTNYARAGLLKLGDHKYPKGLLLCPEKTEGGGRAQVTYTLDGSLRGATRFKAVVGIDDAMRTTKGGSAVFIVEVRRQGQWQRVAETPVIKFGQSQVLDVNITGADQLRLLTTDGGDGTNCDHALWADARLQ